MKQELLVRCECHSLDHIAELSLFLDDPPEMYLALHMSTWRGVFRRIWLALCYIFGYSRHGHWDEIVINKEQAEKIVKLCNTYITAKESRLTV